MTPEEFVESIRQVVRDGAVVDVLAVAARGGGRGADRDLIEASRWVQNLPPDELQRLKTILHLASHMAVFGFLAVLDGVRAIEDGPNKGVLQLTYENDGATSLLTAPRGPYLHDLLDAKPRGGVTDAG